MCKIIIEVGSTVTKIHKYDGNELTPISTKTILFKKNYKIKNKLKNEDVGELILTVKDLKEKYTDINVYGTSIFRDLDYNQREEFLNLFYKKTGVKFNIITAKEENEITVKGIVKNIKGRVAVFIGGGGSTEIAICENGKIIEMNNSKIGVVDIIEKFPDLTEDISKSNYTDMKLFVKENLDLPKLEADVLILGGGAHRYFAYNSGISYEPNRLYESNLQPIMMDIETRKKDTEAYLYEKSLEKIKENVEDKAWWDFTRAMCLMIITVAEEIGAKYIVPTDIGLVNGLIE